MLPRAVAPAIAAVSRITQQARAIHVRMQPGVHIHEPEAYDFFEPFVQEFIQHHVVKKGPLKGEYYADSAKSAEIIAPGLHKSDSDKYPHITIDLFTEEPNPMTGRYDPQHFLGREHIVIAD